MKIEGIEVFKGDLLYADGVYKLSGNRMYTTFDATIVRLVQRLLTSGRPCHRICCVAFSTCTQ